MQNIQLYTQKSVCATITRPFGEVGGTHFAKIEDKKLLRKISYKNLTSGDFLVAFINCGSGVLQDALGDLPPFNLFEPVCVFPHEPHLVSSLKIQAVNADKKTFFDTPCRQ